jgi:hypothetical protein
MMLLLQGGRRRRRRSIEFEIEIGEARWHLLPFK